MMNIISWIVLGLIVGILAKWIMPGKDGGGFILTVVLGIAGALVGGFLASLVGISAGGFSLVGLAVATAGALLILFAYRKFFK